MLLRKGHDNEKITSPVATRTSELAYGIVHHPAYVWFNLFTTLALLLLAVGEHPVMIRIYGEEREPVVRYTGSVLLHCCLLSIHYYQCYMHYILYMTNRFKTSSTCNYILAVIARLYILGCLIRLDNHAVLSPVIDQLTKCMPAYALTAETFAISTYAIYYRAS